MEHRVVVTMFAKERNVLAQIHILQVIGDEAAVTALNALAEFGDDLRRIFHFLILRHRASMSR